jgi:Flp pilus assembly pilin Flp
MNRLRRLRRSQSGQSATEYVLAISVLVIAMAGAFYEFIGQGNVGPIGTSFEYARKTVEAPYP